MRDLKLSLSNIFSGARRIAMLSTTTEARWSVREPPQRRVTSARRRIYLPLTTSHAICSATPATAIFLPVNLSARADLTRPATTSMQRFSIRSENRGQRLHRIRTHQNAKNQADMLDRDANAGNFPQAACRHLDTLRYFDTITRHQASHLIETL
jgi:hypothetical protein